LVDRLSFHGSTLPVQESSELLFAIVSGLPFFPVQRISMSKIYINMLDSLGKSMEDLHEIRLLIPNRLGDFDPTHFEGVPFIEVSP